MANWRDDLKSTLEKKGKTQSSKPNVSTTKSTSNTKKKSNKKQTTGTKNAGSLQDQIKTTLDKIDYTPPEKRLYDLKLDNGKYFGKISYSAYNAILGNNLDNYMPKDSDERKVLENFKKYVGTSDTNDNTSNLTKEQQAYIKYAVNKETEIKGVNNKQKLLGGDTATFVAAPKKSGWDKFVEGAKDILLPKGSNAKKIYDEVTGFIEDDTGWTDDQIAQLAINALHRADSGDTSDFAIVDRAYARLSRSSKYKDSDLVLALKEAQKSWGASPWKAAGLNVKAAVAGMSSDISSFANSLGADHVPILKDITESSIAYANKAKEDAAKYNKGSYGEYLGTLTQGTVNLVPYMILGSGKTAQTALTKGPQYLTYIKTVANNPSFWYSLTTMWGNKYQEALDGGASEADALKNAALYAIPAALIEVGSGLGSEAMAGQELTETIIEEIGEEIAQDLISGISDKATTKPNLPLFSVKEDAVVNPVDLLKTAVTTAPIVAIAGGANMAINNVANKYNQKQELKKLVSDPKVVDAIVNFTDNTYKRATQGLSTQNATTVNAGDTFVDTKSNNIIKAVERNDNTSTVEITSADGKTETKTLPNKTVDSLITDLRYTKVNTFVANDVSVAENVSVDAETSADNVVANDEVAVTETPTVNIGDTFVNTKTNDRITVVDRNDTHTTVKIITPNEEVFTKVVDNAQADKAFLDDRYQKVEYTLDEPETIETETVSETSAPRDINLTRYGNYYAVYGEDAKTLAANLKMKTQKRTINGVSTDVLLLPADLAQEIAPVIAEDFNFIFSDNPSTPTATTEAENTPVADENVVADEETSTDDVNATEDRIYVVANAINDTIIPEAKDGILTGMDNKGVDGGLVEFAELLTRMYQNEGTLNEIADFFTDKGERVIAAIEGRTEAVSEVETTTTPTEIEDTEVVESPTVPEVETAEEVVADNAIPTEVLNNQQKNDTIVEETVTEESPVVEREDNGNGRKRNSILPENSGRSDNGGTEKQAERLPSFEQRNKGKNETERRKFTSEILDREQVEVVNDGNHEYVRVKPEAYNDDMLSMVEDAKSKGVELGFFVGDARVIGEDITDDFYVDGIKFNSSKVLVRYDGSRTPQKIAKHEMVHAKWHTSAIQKIKDTILGSLTAKEKQAILSQERYARYQSEAYNGSEEIALEEFVCDVMAGMNDYITLHEESVNNYWYGDESVESYNAADYTTSTDAGGAKINSENGTKDGRRFSLSNSKSGMANDLLLPYNDELAGFINQRGDYIIDSYEKLINLVNLAFDNPQQKATAYFGIIPPEIISKIEKSIPNLPRELNGELFKPGKDYSIATTLDSIRHLADEKSLTKDEIIDYLDRMADTIVEFDTVAFDYYYEKGNRMNGLLLKKSFEDGVLTSFEIVSNKKRSLNLQTFYMQKGDYIKKKSAETTLLDKKPTANVQDEERSNSNSRVPQNEPSVKENVSNTDSTKSKGVRYSISKEQSTDYMKAVENEDMETAQKMVDEVAEKAFSDSKVRGTDGKLLKVYHGTVNDFTVFKREFANIEGDFGKGYYFSSNEYDVDANYANEEGPDLKNKIAHYAEKLEWEDEYSDLSYEEREEIARQKFITSEPNTITAYLNMENPVYITPDEKGTLLDYNEEYDEEYDEYGEPEGLLIDFVEALNEIAADYSYRAVDFNFLYEYAYDNGGVFASDAVKTIKHRISDELTDENGDLALNEVIRLAFEQIGFDGIIDTSVYYKFRNMNGMDSGTTHYIVFDSEQIKSAEPVTYDDDGNAISLDDRFNKDNVDFRYSVSKPDNLKTQKRIEGIAQEIGSHEEFIELAKQNTQEFVGKIKENESLQKRLNNAKRQMLKSPKPAVNEVKVGKITQEILKEVDSTLNAKDLREEITSIYNEYFAAIKDAKGVESKVNEANDIMLERFGKLAVDIANSGEAFTESEEYEMLKSYIKNTRIKVPDSAKADAHFGEFCKSHMGTFNLTNDGTDIDVVYMELCSLFPGKFDETISHPADQLLEMDRVLEGLKPYAYNPNLEYMEDVIEHIVYRFSSEVDGLAVMPKTKAQKMAEKSAVDKDMALEKERTKFEQQMDKHKKDSEDVIRKLQKKIDDAKYVRYWEGRLSKEEKAQAINKIREKRDIAILKTKIRNIVSDMRNKLNKSEKSGGYPKELVQAVADVCSVIDFHTGRTNKDGTPTKASLKLDALQTKYHALKNNPNYDFSSEYSAELEDKISELNDKVGGKRVVDLTKVELEDLKDILSEISHTLSTATEQIGKADGKANAELALEIIESLESKKDLNDMNKGLLLRILKLKAQSRIATSVNPHRINKMIAGYDQESVWWQLHDEINRGNRKTAKFVMEANKPFDELTDGGGNEIAFYDFRTKKIKTGIKYTDGSEVEIPKSIICEMIMMWNRKDGRTHLETGGAKIPDIELYNKGQTVDSIKGGQRTNPITENDIKRLKGMLDSYDKAWIESAHKLFNKVSKDAINETSMQLVGRELARTENYIRMYVDQDFVGKEVGKDQNNNVTLEGHGSLKETKPESKQPLLFRGVHENVYDNIDFVSKYYGLAIPIRNFNKVYRMTFRGDNGQSSVQEIIGKKFGGKIQNDVVEKYITELQTPRKRAHNEFDAIKGRWLGAIFWGKYSSALKQTSSYWTAASILGEDSLAKGLTNFVKSPKRTKSEINKHSGTLYKRSQGLSTTELGDRANRKRLAGASNKVTKFINEKIPILQKTPQGLRPGNWLQAMDVTTSAALWEACKVEVSKTMKATDEGYMQAVTDLWERVIEETQSNYDVAHRPEVLKDTSEFKQVVAMFTTDAHQKLGLLFDAYNEFATKSNQHKNDGSAANEKAKKEAGRKFSKASRAIVYSALWMGLMKVGAQMLARKFKPYIDDEEKEITADSVAKQYMIAICEDLLSSIMPVNSSFILQGVDSVEKGYDFVDVPVFDVLEDFAKAIIEIYKAAANDDGDVLKALLDAAPRMGNFLGVPVENITDIVNGIKGYAGDIMAGEFAHDLTDYTSGNKSFYNYGDLASCIVSGNSEKEKKLLDYYSANGKEIAKGSLTKEIKPAYVQMYVDSPNEAYNIKRKLILDYGYSEETIGKWTVAEYFENCLENPEYASEIASAVRNERGWKDSYYSTIRSKYKSVYKEGNEADTEALKKSLTKDLNISSSDIRTWEKEVDESIKKKTDEQEAEKKKYR